MSVIPLNPNQTKSFDSRLDDVETHITNVENDNITFKAEQTQDNTIFKADINQNIEDFKGGINPQIETLNASLNDKANETEVADYASLKDLATNITRDTFFNADPSGSTKNYSDRQIVLIGDSHGWGEGSPNFQGASAGNSKHAPWIHNAGFFDRIRKYFYEKWDSEPWRVIPLFDKANPIHITTGAIALDAQNNQPIISKELYTRTPRIVKGKYYISYLTKSDELTQSTKDALNTFGNAELREDTYSDTEYMYNADIGLFGKGIITFGNDANGKSVVCFEMEKPSRYAIVSLYCAQNWNFGKLKVELLDETNCDNSGNPNYEQVVTTFGNKNYGVEAPSVYILSSNSVSANLSTPSNAVVNASDITIDATTGVNSEGFYIIDFKQKKKGIIRLSYGGNGTYTTGADSVLGTTCVRTRGVLFGNRDMVKNFSFGGHTTGAMLGLSASYWNETRNHIADVKAYMTGTIKSAIIEAPIVNEHIVQTSIAAFKTNLSSIMSTLGTLNVLIFTTLGEKSKDFGTDASAITYDQYAQAVKDWAAAQGGQVTFLDCRSYLKKLVSQGIVTSSALYINDAHPSPLANELIYNMLKRAVDMKY